MHKPPWFAVFVAYCWVVFELLIWLCCFLFSGDEDNFVHNHHTCLMETEEESCSENRKHLTSVNVKAVSFLIPCATSWRFIFALPSWQQPPKPVGLNFLIWIEPSLLTVCLSYLKAVPWECFRGIANRENFLLAVHQVMTGAWSFEG